MGRGRRRRGRRRRKEGRHDRLVGGKWRGSILQPMAWLRKEESLAAQAILLAACDLERADALGFE